MKIIDSIKKRIEDLFKSLEHDIPSQEVVPEVIKLSPAEMFSELQPGDEYIITTSTYPVHVYQGMGEAESPKSMMKGIEDGTIIIIPKTYPCGNCQQVKISPYYNQCSICGAITAR